MARWALLHGFDYPIRIEAHDRLQGQWHFELQQRGTLNCLAYIDQESESM